LSNDILKKLENPELIGTLLKEKVDEKWITVVNDYSPGEDCPSVLIECVDCDVSKAIRLSKAAFVKFIKILPELKSEINVANMFNLSHFDEN